MTEISTPGEPGDYLTNRMEVTGGSVLNTEDDAATVVTWLVFHARGTDSADNTVRHCYALEDAQLVWLTGMLMAHAQRRGLFP